MKLWVDDIRPAPEGWTRAETISEAIAYIQRYGMKEPFGFNKEGITHVSLDHDISIPFELRDTQTHKLIHKLNVPSPDTFQVVAKFMVEVMMNPVGCLCEDIILTTHSSNPRGREAIVNIFDECGYECKETPAEQINRDNSNRD